MKLLKPLKTIFLMLLGSLLILVLTVTSGATINFLLIGSLLVLVATDARQTYLWAIFAGIIFETISPLPPLISIVALLFTIFCTDFLLKNYFSHRTFLGIAASAAIANLLYEISAFLLARLTSLVLHGFTPALDYSYVSFIALRILWTTLIFVILFLAMQRLFPKVRGTLLVP